MGHGFRYNSMTSIDLVVVGSGPISYLGQLYFYKSCHTFCIWVCLDSLVSLTLCFMLCTGVGITLWTIGTLNILVHIAVLTYRPEVLTNPLVVLGLFVVYRCLVSQGCQVHPMCPWWTNTLLVKVSKCIWNAICSCISIYTTSSGTSGLLC